LANWLAIPTRHNKRGGCHEEGAFCVNDEYKLEISQVRTGDQLVMANPVGKYGNVTIKIMGLYKIISEESRNPFISKHSKNSYSHRIGIKVVRTVNPELDYDIILKTDLEKFDDGLYLNNNIEINTIKSISDEQFSIFKKWIDLVNCVNNHVRKPFQDTDALCYLLPFTFDEKRKVKTVQIGGETIEYHSELMEFEKILFSKAFIRHPERIKRRVMIYKYDNNDILRICGHGHVRTTRQKNNVSIQIVDYRKFDSIQPNEDLNRIIQAFSRVRGNSSLKDTPIYPIDEVAFHYIVDIYEEQTEKNAVRVASAIVNDGKDSQIQSILEFPTDKRRVWSLSRMGQKIVRQIALQMYRQCALCDMQDPRMLVGAHIVSWKSYPKDSNKKNNIICLCIIHHKLFDDYKLTISDDYRVEFSSQFSEMCEKSNMYKIIKVYTNKKIKLPSDKQHFPKPEYLHIHNRLFYEYNVANWLEAR